VPCPKRRVLKQQRVYLLMQAMAPLVVRRDLEFGNMLRHRGLPLGQFFIAAIEA